jgi:hypothetical protein
MPKFTILLMPFVLVGVLEMRGWAHHPAREPGVSQAFRERARGEMVQPANRRTGEPANESSMISFSGSPVLRLGEFRYRTLGGCRDL